MGNNDDAFLELDAQVAEQLSETLLFRLTRPQAGGAYSAAAGTETGGQDITTVDFRAIRERDRVDNIPGASGGYSRVRVVEFSVSKRDITLAPLENDIIVDPTGGVDVKRRVTRVSEEVNRNRWRIVTHSAA